MLSNLLTTLLFANNTILSYLIICLYFLIPAVVEQTFNPNVEFVIPTGIPVKKTKAEMEVHPVAVAKIQNYSI